MNFLLLLGLIDRIYGRDWIVRASDWNKGRLYLAEKFGYGKRLKLNLNRYRRRRQKVDASIFDSVLSHTRRSDASEKKKKIAYPLLDVSACGQVSSPRLYRLKFKD